MASVASIGHVNISKVAAINKVEIAKVASFNHVAVASAAPATLELSESFCSFDWNGTNCDNDYVGVTASAGNVWTATPNEAWINTSPGGGTGDGYFIVSVELAGGDRYGSISVTSSAPTQTVDVTQEEYCV